MEFNHNYVVDATNGDDSNDGSASFPFASLTHLYEVVDTVRDQSSISIFIRANHFTDQHLDFRFTLSDIYLEFEPNSILEWTLDESRSAIQINRAGASIEIEGNGLHITGFNIGSGNGVGVTNAIGLVRNVYIDNVLDGISAHGTGHLEAYNVTVTDAHKFAVAHVNNSTSYTENSFFQPANDAVGILYTDPSEGHIFVRSTFIASPDGSVVNLRTSEGTQFIDSILGSPEVALRLLGPGEISGGFANLYRGDKSLIKIDAQSDSTVIFEGGTSYDWLEGGISDDSLYGLQGDDTLVGNAGTDYMLGGDGDDFLIGGDGDDLLIGDGA